ncbi:MAG: response regulator, partial [Paracoccaceae bacterium]|nr:response regulator [Paracoccaceae bacterium]
MRILIADDHDLLRDTLVLFLEGAGDIQTAAVGTFGEACIEMEKGEPFDLVLLDYAMPGMNGLDGLRRAIELSKGKPVAVMSGTAPKSIAQDALD